MGIITVKGNFSSLKKLFVEFILLKKNFLFLLLFSFFEYSGSSLLCAVHPDLIGRIIGSSGYLTFIVLCFVDFQSPHLSFMLIIAQWSLFPYIPQFKNSIHWASDNLMLVYPLTSNQTSSFSHRPHTTSINQTPPLKHAISSCSHQQSLFIVESSIPDSTSMTCQSE